MPAGVLDLMLAARLTPTARAWLATAAARAAERVPLALALAESGRACGREPLAPTAAETAAADRVRPGWTLATWTVADAARTRLLLASGDAATALLPQLIACASADEAVSFYRALPALTLTRSDAARLVALGARSNQRDVYEAAALDSPLPATALDDGAWNQLVLKCFFISADCDRIQRLRARLNPDLRQMLSGYARERRAAHRPADPRLDALAADSGPETRNPKPETRPC
jgi:hypothetical protein